MMNEAAPQAAAPIEDPVEKRLRDIIYRMQTGVVVSLAEEAEAIRLLTLGETQTLAVRVDAGPVKEFTEKFIAELGPITGREQVRRALDALTECTAPITEALREAPYRLASPAFDVLDTLSETVAAELGVEVAGRCEGCEELVFADEPYHTGEDVSLCETCAQPAMEAYRKEQAEVAAFKPKERYLQLARDLLEDEGMLAAFNNVHDAHPDGFVPAAGDEFRYTRLAQAAWDNVAEFVRVKHGDDVGLYHLTANGSELGLTLKWLEQNPDAPDERAPSAIIEPPASPATAADDDDEEHWF